jgi:hypothetical protein
MNEAFKKLGKNMMSLANMILVLFYLKNLSFGTLEPSVMLSISIALIFIVLYGSGFILIKINTGNKDAYIELGDNIMIMSNLLIVFILFEYVAFYQITIEIFFAILYSIIGLYSIGFFFIKYGEN